MSSGVERKSKWVATIRQTSNVSGKTMTYMELAGHHGPTRRGDKENGAG